MNIQSLQTGALLQGGKYRIEKVLGEGGFGITYLALQTSLNRLVAIKEFFMEKHCNRSDSAPSVSVASEGSRELVECFRQKFIKEAQTIAALSHPYIIRIHDIFEENGTAYYVMEYQERGSLAEYLKRQGKLSTTEALHYIRQVADALKFLHEKQRNHLDVKPGNILLDNKMNAILIDFGVSKHYDGTGSQTTNTPVAVSNGYAPLEQYDLSGVSKFSPTTDIYSLAATLYKLLTGNTPPKASEIGEMGLPALPNTISPHICHAIKQGMQPWKKDRPQSIDAFLSLLTDEEITTDKRFHKTKQSPKQEKKAENERTQIWTKKTSFSSNTATSQPATAMILGKGLMIIFALSLLDGLGDFILTYIYRLEEIYVQAFFKEIFIYSPISLIRFFVLLWMYHSCKRRINSNGKLGLLTLLTATVFNLILTIDDVLLKTTNIGVEISVSFFTFYSYFGNIICFIGYLLLALENCTPKYLKGILIIYAPASFIYTKIILFIYDNPIADNIIIRASYFLFDLIYFILVYNSVKKWRKSISQQEQ